MPYMNVRESTTGEWLPIDVDNVFNEKMRRQLAGALGDLSDPSLESQDNIGARTVQYR